MNFRTLFKPRKLARVIRARLKDRAALKKAIELGLNRIKDDPNYRPDLVPASFAAHPGPRADDSALLQRISAAYRKAKEDQRSAGEAFNVSNEWLHIYERKLGPVMSALSSGNVAELDRMYSNFFRDPCSIGLAGMPSSLEKKYFGSANISKRYRDLALCEGIHRFNLWKEKTNNAFSAQDLACPLIGNPYGGTMDGVFLRPGVDYQHCYAQEVKSLLPSTESQLVVELGGGFGGMGFFLVRDIPQATYVDLDLPEALALASYYLMKAFPDLPVMLYGEGELTQQALASFRIVMMPSFEILKIADRSVGVAFNSYSLAEMSPASIRQYIQEITRITRGYFLHVNHIRRAVLSADDFGVEDYGFRLLRRQFSGWTAGLNPDDADEFEFLYQCTDPGIIGAAV